MSTAACCGLQSFFGRNSDLFACNWKRRGEKFTISLLMYTWRTPFPLDLVWAFTLTFTYLYLFSLCWKLIQLRHGWKNVQVQVQWNCREVQRSRDSRGDLQQYFLLKQHCYNGLIALDIIFAMTLCCKMEMGAGSDFLLKKKSSHYGWMGAEWWLNGGCL